MPRYLAEIKMGTGIPHQEVLSALDSLDPAVKTQIAAIYLADEYTTLPKPRDINWNLRTAAVLIMTDDTLRPESNLLQIALQEMVETCRFGILTYSVLHLATPDPLNPNGNNLYVTDGAPK